MVGNAESVMKDSSETKLPLTNSADLALSFAAAQNLCNSRQYSLSPLSVLHQHYLANLTSAQAQRMLYPNILNRTLPAFPPTPLVNSANHRTERYRHPLSLPPLISTGGTTLPQTFAGLTEASRQTEIMRLLQDNNNRELLLHLTQIAQQSSGPSVSSPAPVTSISTSYKESTLKTEKTPPENQIRRSSRSSSLSPSAYLTPRSLNGSPSGSQTMSPNNLNGRSPSSSSSQTSPPETNNRVIDSSLVSTPMRKPVSTRPEKQFLCKICTKTFGYKHVLQNHERTHTGEKPFKCGECGKRFTRDHHLKTHKRLHTGEKPYNCPHCDRSFVQVANLRRHVRVHTGEKPYTCESCGLKFSDSNQLKAHGLTHSGERPYYCHKCQGRYRRRHHMLNHRCSTERTLASPSDSTVFHDDDTAEETSTSTAHSSSFEEETNGSDQHEKRRGRKSKVPKRVLHRDSNLEQLNKTPSPPNNSNTLFTSPQLPPTPLPEQTEPEDLSMNSTSKTQGDQIYRANIALTTAEFVEPIRFPKEELMSDEEAIVTN